MGATAANCTTATHNSVSRGYEAPASHLRSRFTFQSPADARNQSRARRQSRKHHRFRRQPSEPGARPGASPREVLRTPATRLCGGERSARTACLSPRIATLHFCLPRDLQRAPSVSPSGREPCRPGHGPDPSGCQSRLPAGDLLNILDQERAYLSGGAQVSKSILHNRDLDGLQDYIANFP